jgi:phosphate-selective porin
MAGAFSAMAQAPQAAAVKDESGVAEVAKALLPGSKEGAIKLKGYVQVRYTAYEENGKLDGFSLKSAYVVPYGTISPGWDFEVEMDAADVSGKLMRNAFIEYNGFGQGARIRVGQLKPSYSEEFWTSSSNIATIDRAKAVTSLAAERDIGLSILGLAAKGKLDYGLGVFNGAGINAADDNDGKDFAGRITVAPLKGVGEFIDNLRIGAGAWVGSRTNGDIKRYVGILSYAVSRLKLQGEYLLQNTGEYADTDTTTVAEKDANGAYGLGTFDVWSRGNALVQLVAKYESYEPNKDKSDDQENATTIGVNWFFSKYSKLMLNYRIRGEEKSFDNNEIVAQMQVKL